MWRYLGRMYARRIVNVNVNILLAGILALGPVVLAVKLTYRLLGVQDPSHLDHSDKLIITVVTFVTDVVFDVVIYYILHWLANHLPHKLKKASGATVLDAEHVPFMKDASVVQLQRALISPVLYICWLGTQYMLLGVIDEWIATVCGWLVGITIARTLHTIWMIRAQRWARGRIAAAVNAVVPGTIGPNGIAPNTPPAAPGPGQPQPPSSGAAPNVDHAPAKTPPGQMASPRR